MSRSRIEARLGEPALGGDAGALDLLARGDLGLLEGLALGDLERLQRALALDPALVDDAVAGEPRPLDLLLGDDLGLAAGALGAGHLDGLGGKRDLALALGDLDRLAAGDLQLLLRRAARSMRSRSTASRRAISSRSVSSRAASSVISRARRRAISRFWISSSLTMRVSASDPLLGDPRLLGRLGGGDLRLLRLLLAERPLAGELGALDGAADLDLALLFEAGIFALALDLEHAPLRFEILVADLDHRLLLDLVAHLAARLDRLGQRGQALGVEGVGRIEEFEAGLVDVDERDVLELEAVLGERLRGLLAHPRHELAALLVDLLERHLGGDGAERGGELALEQVADAVRLHGPAAEGLRGERHRLAGRLDAQEELGDEVDAHPVAGDRARWSRRGAPRSA